MVVPRTFRPVLCPCFTNIYFFQVSKISLKEVIQAVNAVIRGWVNYFRIGNSNSAFCKVCNYTEKKVRRFVMKKKKQKGFGWKRWSREVIYQEWGLYNDYLIQYLHPKTALCR